MNGRGNNDTDNVTIEVAYEKKWGTNPTEIKINCCKLTERFTVCAWCILSCVLSWDASIFFVHVCWLFLQFNMGSDWIIESGNRSESGAVKHKMGETRLDCRTPWGTTTIKSIVPAQDSQKTGKFKNQGPFFRLILSHCQDINHSSPRSSPFLLATGQGKEYDTLLQTNRYLWPFIRLVEDERWNVKDIKTAGSRASHNNRKLFVSYHSSCMMLTGYREQNNWLSFLWFHRCPRGPFFTRMQYNQGRILNAQIRINPYI